MNKYKITILFNKLIPKKKSQIIYDEKQQKQAINTMNNWGID